MKITVKIKTLGKWFSPSIQRSKCSRFGVHEPHSDKSSYAVVVDEGERFFGKLLLDLTRLGVKSIHTTDGIRLGIASHLRIEDDEWIVCRCKTEGDE